LGFNFAVLLYVALHLRKVAGARPQGTHFVADIDGNRMYWARS
jgi:hypothetical protein